MGPGTARVFTLPGENEHSLLSLIPLVGSGALKILRPLIPASPSSHLHPETLAHTFAPGRAYPGSPALH